MTDLNQDPDQLLYQAERQASRLRILQDLKGKMPSRKAKGSTLANLWTLLETLHAMLCECDAQADRAEASALFAAQFEDTANYTYTVLKPAKVDAE